MLNFILLVILIIVPTVLCIRSFAKLTITRTHKESDRVSKRKLERTARPHSAQRRVEPQFFTCLSLCVSVPPHAHTHTHIHTCVCMYICSQIEIQIQAPHMAHSASSGPLTAVVFVVFEHFWPQWEMHSAPAAGK